MIKGLHEDYLIFMPPRTAPHTKLPLTTMTNRQIKRAIRIGASYGWNIHSHGNALIADKANKGFYCESSASLITEIRKQAKH